MASLSRQRILSRLNDSNRTYIQDRVNYYIRRTAAFALSDKSAHIKDLSPKKQSAYYFDTLDVARFFPNARFDYLFGDIVNIPDTPTLLKSRPITDDNHNSVLLKLNRVRHYNFIDDNIAYQDKTDSIVWRGKAASDHHRVDVCRQYFDHPRCDIAVSTPLKDNGDTSLTRPALSIEQQLQHKFILSLEGNDVATNLKWIMSSNSLCFMRRPRFETWYMEGRLIPNVHYVELRDDFSDLLEKMDYYSANPKAAAVINLNAKAYVKEFLDEPREQLISLLVMKRYLELSDQI